MKKQNIILTSLLLVASYVASAETVKLYGTIDLGYGIGNNGYYEGQKGNDGKFQQWGNGKTTSVWGLVGEEDLGSGHKVYFHLESEINPETGAGGDQLFGEAAYVGIEGAFGSVQAGRQNTVISNIMSEFDVSDGAPTLSSSLGNAGISGDAQRFLGEFHSKANSALVYTSPNFSGFALQAGLVLKNNDIFDAASFPFVAQAKNIYTIGATYEISGLMVGATFESKPFDMSGLDLSSSWGIGAKYDFGNFLISASYFDNHFKVDGRGFSLGVRVPIEAFEVGAQVAYNTKAYSPIDGERIKPLAWEVFSYYNFSERTQIYLQYGGINSDAKNFNEASRKYSAAFGIVHNF